MRRTRPPLLALLATVACSGVAAAQPERIPSFSPVVRFMIVLVTSLLVGGLTVALAPRFAERTADSVREEPLPALLVGITGLVVEFVLVVLVAALLGPLVLLVAIPLVVLGAVTQAIGVIALGCVVLERFDEKDLWRALVVGAPLVAVAMFIPLLGDVLWFVVGVLGLGAVVRDQVLS